jgi:DNA modification methylase
MTSHPGLQDHPTVKPTAMLQDALIDLSHREEIILDPFGGSGSTLIACEKTHRICRSIELDPLYVDVIIRRYQLATGRKALLDQTEETFDELLERRSKDTGAAN